MQMQLGLMTTSGLTNAVLLQLGSVELLSTCIGPRKPAYAAQTPKDFDDELLSAKPLSKEKVDF